MLLLEQGFIFKNNPNQNKRKKKEKKRRKQKKKGEEKKKEKKKKKEVTKHARTVICTIARNTQIKQPLFKV